MKPATADRIREFNDVWLKKCGLDKQVVEWLISTDYFTAPASTRFHGVYKGGLFEHSMTVAKQLDKWTEDNLISWCRPESPYIVGLLHDVCKLWTYVYDYDTKNWKYSDEKTDFKGHGDKSLMILSSKILLTEEEALCIRYHMGAFTDKAEWEYYTRAVHKYPNVLWTHTADMIATHVMDI